MHAQPTLARVNTRLAAYMGRSSRSRTPRKINMVVRCIQINLQHVKAASAVLAQTFYEDHFDIAFIPEPYIYGNQIKELPEFTNKDQIAVKVSLSLGVNTQELIICSAYLPGNSRDYEFLPLQGLVDYCGRQKLQLIVGCDANAHNTIWSSSNINQR
ncbi:uncharacterized protein LOC118750461, partial [Rhagoletis pomonella]|uniref:uncharacterized protein LOC118750461 n=1 Tax=Rhagoletis pomonella TaxID=28610 RepID=UPI00178448AE